MTKQMTLQQFITSNIFHAGNAGEIIVTFDIGPTIIAEARPTSNRYKHTKTISLCKT